MIIDANIIRALNRIKVNPKDASHLVEEGYEEELLKLLNSKVREEKGTDDAFDLQKEFKVMYAKIKQSLDGVTNVDDPEALDVIKEAHKFLSFMLKNEERISNVQAVKDFKEIVLSVLDEEDPMLKDRVITKLSEANR